MKREPLRVFFACALGAFIGGLTAQGLGSFWLLGALLGGTVAYVAVDYRRFFTGLTRAWHKTYTWQPSLKLRAEASAFLTAMTVGLILPLLIAPVFLAVSWHAPFGVVDVAVINLSWDFFCWVFATFIFFLSLVPDNEWNRKNDEGVEAYARRVNDDIDNHRRIRRNWNPIAVFIAIGCAVGYAVLHLPSWTLSALRFVTHAVVGLTRFCRLAFIYVHSDLRTLCFVDAAFGTIFGYWGGSVIGGAILGGLLGLINYWLVSVKLLRLNPSLRNDA